MVAFITGANSQHCTGDHPSELQMQSRPLPRLHPFMPPTLELRAGHIHLWCLLSSTAPSEAICKKRTVKIFSRAESKAISGQCLQCVAGGCERDVAGRKGP